MSTAIKISKEIAEDARIISKVTRRSMAGQIEYWAFIGKCYPSPALNHYSSSIEPPSQNYI